MEKWVVFLEERYFSLIGKVWEFCLQHDWPWFISLVYILNFQVTYWIMPSDRRENVCVEQSHAPTRNWLPWHISVFRHWWPSEWEMERGMMSQIFRQARTIKHIWMCLICAPGELFVSLLLSLLSPSLMTTQVTALLKGLTSWTLLSSSVAVLESLTG